MANDKKRGLDPVWYTYHESVQLRPVKKKRQTAKKGSWLKPPSQDLMQKLPGELRNKIYGLVLPTGTEYLMEPRWRHPRIPKEGLFRVSRQIRQESLSFWTQSNKVSMRIYGQHIARDLRRLAEIRTICGGKVPASLEIIMMCPVQSSLPEWFPFATLIFNEPIDPAYADQATEGRYWMRLFGARLEERGRMTALEELITMAVKTKHRGHSLAIIREDFRDWAWAKWRMIQGRSDGPHAQKAWQTINESVKDGESLPEPLRVLPPPSTEDLKAAVQRT